MKLSICIPLAALGLLVPGCFADEPGAKKAAAKKPAAGSPAPRIGTEGQRVHIDPVTKKIKEPEREDIAALSAAAPAATGTASPIQAVRLPNGTLKVALPEEFMEATVISLRPDGKFAIRCVTGMDQANKVVIQAAPVSVKKDQLDEK